MSNIIINNNHSYFCLFDIASYGYSNESIIPETILNDCKSNKSTNI